MEQILHYIESNKERYLGELKELLAIPSISTSPQNKRDVESCAQWVASHLKNIGMPRVEIFPTKGHPVVYAEWLGAPEKPTVLMYGHYDVQPAVKEDGWKTDPFTPTVVGDKLFARGSADAFCSAVCVYQLLLTSTNGV